jgi:DNA-binding PadR family transcriptional regulator
MAYSICLMVRPTRPSPLGLAVLGLLYGGALHPYRMQRLLKEWGKDQVINVGQRSGLYKTIDRLGEAGLIAARHTERLSQYPERTVYEITADGREVLIEWLGDMLSQYRNEYPGFPAALSFAMLLGPEGTLSALRERLQTLDAVVGSLRHLIEDSPPQLPRITLLETEYQLAVAEAERRWVEQIVAELAVGTLRWGPDDFAGVEDAYRADER